MKPRHKETFIHELLTGAFDVRPILKLPQWGYPKPFIALSLDGVFRCSFARVFTLLLVLLFIRFISFACSESLMAAHPSFFAFFSVVIFGFSLPRSVLRRVIFVPGMLSPGPGSLIGLTGKLNAQVLRPRYPRPRWYPSYLFGRPLAICFLGTPTTSQREGFFTTFPVGM